MTYATILPRSENLISVRNGPFSHILPHVIESVMVIPGYDECDHEFTSAFDIPTI